LDEELEIPHSVRIHWTGCPNSCGQAQVGDIGLMGSPAKLDGKAVEGVRIFTGGRIGEGAKLATEFEKGVPANPESLVPRLKEIMIEEFGCGPKLQ
jgi:ferredoxin-nitrite reductase